jgi:hypothetical protein
MRISGVAPSRTVGSKKRSRIGRPPLHHPCAAGDRVVDVLADLREPVLVDQRPDLRLRVVDVAGPEVRHGPGETTHELVVDAVLDEDAIGADARLPVVAKLGEDGPVHRGVEVGVVEDEKGCVAAELQREPLQGRTHTVPSAACPRRWIR